MSGEAEWHRRTEVSRCPRIDRKLTLCAGLVKGIQSVTAEDLPVAIIKDASSGQQRVWMTTVSAMIAATKGESLSPCIIVVGHVVAARQLSPSWGDGADPQSDSRL